MVRSSNPFVYAVDFASLAYTTINTVELDTSLHGISLYLDGSMSGIGIKFIDNILQYVWCNGYESCSNSDLVFSSPDSKFCGGIFTHGDSSAMYSNILIDNDVYSIQKVQNIMV